MNYTIKFMFRICMKIISKILLFFRKYCGRNLFRTQENSELPQSA